MEKLNAIFLKEFKAELEDSEFKSSAVYYHSMDYVEYKSVDSFTVSRRIDPILTLIYNRSRDTVVGFQLKGFKCIITDHFTPILDISGEDFLSLVSVLESVALKIGEKIIGKAIDTDSYKQAYKLAKSNPEAMRVNLPTLAA